MPAVISRNSRFAVDVLDVIDAIGSADNLVALFALLDDTIQSFKLDYFIVSGIPFLTEPLDSAVLLRSWPQEWYEIYCRHQFLTIDPTVRMCQSSTMPFEWSEAVEGSGKRGDFEVMDRARDFGLVQGFSIPIHGIGGRTDCVSLGGRAPDLNGQTKPALHLLAMYAFERARRLVEARAPAAGERTNPLTAREQEVLAWAAAGKSYVDVADILGVTERTVTAHMVNATTKLGATNRTHAVVKAMQAKLINV